MPDTSLLHVPMPRRVPLSVWLPRLLLVTTAICLCIAIARIHDIYQTGKDASKAYRMRHAKAAQQQIELKQKVLISAQLSSELQQQAAQHISELPKDVP